MLSDSFKIIVVENIYYAGINVPDLYSVYPGLFKYLWKGQYKEGAGLKFKYERIVS